MKAWIGACQIAAVYIGTIIGAGFATGKEILQFFSRFGSYGLLAIIVSGCLFILLGMKMMLKAAELEAKSFEEFNAFLFGRRFGTAATVVQFFMLIGVTGVMLSGAGALFNERLGLPANAGILITIAAGLLIMGRGLTGLLAVNVFVVPMMVIFHLYTAGVAIGSDDFFMNVMKAGESGEAWEVWSAPFSYTAFNLTLAQAVLVPLAFEIKEKDIIRKGAFLGGAGLTFLLVASHISLVQLDGAADYNIPMAQVVEQFSAPLYVLYVFLIYGEIFTSIIGNAYGLKQQMQTYLSWPPVLLFLLIFAACFLLSQVSYGTLLGWLYPLFGLISLLFFIFLWRK
ncbi:YkvI family membrane protein [Bacillus thermotolerans]|uniref:Membrane protein n=1 Tax=Bacillus thermotolerans TaxID=1221996 RepID=A0A0F5IAM0_BACTR|nr:membrane protein [Bacillus thermotolerans]KKB39167.1 membrane protein [Bacillus thermotolerans]KKB42559.1 membrane protein [Bacillus thermotolerans]KKB42644.1 putative membrane protein [Bacillus thermotolerans]